MKNYLNKIKVNGWLRINTYKFNGQIFVEFIKGDDGLWDKEPMIICDAHWIKGIIKALQSLELDY
jgi:hypothetical protein